MKQLYILILPVFFIASKANGQTFEKTFQGWWASTSWTYDFYKNGTYRRVSEGHYGYTTVSGKYIIERDTITLLTGYENTHGTVNEKYILDKDSFLIDFCLRYDYAPIEKQGEPLYYNSKTRLVKYPQIATNNQKTISELESVLNLVFNSTIVKKYCHFDLGVEPPIANYYYLNTTIQVDSLKLIFQPKEEITDFIYIEFKDINQCNDRIEIEIIIYGITNVEIRFYYYKKEEQWISSEPYERKLD